MAPRSRYSLIIRGSKRGLKTWRRALRKMWPCTELLALTQSVTPEECKNSHIKCGGQESQVAALSTHSTDSDLQGRLS